MDRFYSVYLHVDPAVDIREGLCVDAEDDIGTLSDDDAAYDHASHLHFAIRTTEPGSGTDDIPDWEGKYYKPSDYPGDTADELAQQAITAGMLHPSDFIDANQGYHPVGVTDRDLGFEPKSVGYPSRLPWEPGTALEVAPSSYVASDPGGYGVEFTGADATTEVYPLAGGTVRFAGCANGSNSYLGNTVIIETTVGSRPYYAVYGHLGSIWRTSSKPLSRVRLSTSARTNPSAPSAHRRTSTTGGARTPSALRVSTSRSSTAVPSHSTTGVVTDGTDVVPEPLIGEGAYEKFTWWEGTWLNGTTGALRARN